MHRIQFCMLFFLMLFFLTHSNAGESKIRVRFQIFVIQGSVLAETELTEDFDDVWDGHDSEWDTIKENVEIVNRATFSFGSHKLRIREDGCYWDGRKIPFEQEKAFPFDNPNIRQVYSPSVDLIENATTHIKISADQKLQYFEAEPAGGYSLKSLESPTGLDIKLRTRERRDRIYFDEMWTEVRFLKHREPIEGVALPVGKPVIDKRVYEIELSLRENKIYGVLLSLENNQGFVLICFDADE